MRLYVESDGDRHPKDVYICADGIGRIATMHFTGSENQMFKLAREIARCFNLRSPHEGPPDEPPPGPSPRQVYAAVLLGRMARGIPKPHLTNEERERRRKAAAHARECKAKKKLAENT